MSFPRGRVAEHMSFLNYDPMRYEESCTFGPEHYMGHTWLAPSPRTRATPLKQVHFICDRARRVSLGSRLARNSLDPSLAIIVWMFEVRPPIVDGIEFPSKRLDATDDPWETKSFREERPFKACFAQCINRRLDMIKTL
ncbi:hypothetical protein GQ53DRAFT_864116 [Thozetella sp. PMI_491]|nr:hypothetical protein GQ53DRAFT_864116 [Thozetella sp. PMI_491]